MTVPSMLFPLPSPCSLIEKWDFEDGGSEVVEYHTGVNWITKEIRQGRKMEMA